MIGKTQWFQTRKYGGWGLSPKTKEGWIYIGVFVGLVALIQNLPISESIKTIATTIMVVVLIVDVLDIMIRQSKDEREAFHEAVSERNASWAMVASLIAIFGYHSIKQALQGSQSPDMTLLIPIFVGAIAKALTNLYLRNK